jgi:RNA polymerase sigma-70 factor, ECF subfamily
MTDDVNRLRPRMMSVAYRMLGSVADAEDAVQDAFLRYQAAGGVSSTEGFLIRTTTRLCIDRLRARRRRGYVGPWVPEPVETRAAARGDAMAESLTQAFLLLLERLTPDERAAFLLRTVFDYEYAEIGDAVGKSEVAARFLAGVFSKKRRDCEMHATTVNGEPGVVFTSGGAVVQVVALRIEGGVRAVYMTNNPDKLARWAAAEVE